MSDLESLLREAQSTDLDTKTKAVMKLCTLGDPLACDAILAILNEEAVAENDNLLADCVYTLGRIGNKLAIPRLREILATNGNSLAKEEAGRALGKLGDRDFLLRCLSYEDEFTRSYALDGLCLIHGNSPDLFDLAVEALRDESVEVVGFAIGVLGSTGDPRAIPLLRPFIDRPEFNDGGVALSDLTTYALESLEKRSHSS